MIITLMVMIMMMMLNGAVFTADVCYFAPGDVDISSSRVSASWMWHCVVGLSVADTHCQPRVIDRRTF